MVIFEPGEENEKTHAVSREDLTRVRKRLPFLPDQDRFTIG
jgi:hypothetical protein